MCTFRRTILSSLLLICVISSAALGAPSTISYQGRVKLSGGAAPTDGTYTLTFSLYHTVSSAIPIWAETLQVQVTGGLFSVQLGNVHPLGTNFFAGSNRWLGVKYGANPEMTPRTKLTSSPYALYSGISDTSSVAMHALFTDTANYAKASPSTSGWADDGAAVRLTGVTDQVGIGTSTPLSKLHVDGSEILSTGVYAGFKFRDRANGVNDNWVLYSLNNVARLFRQGAGDLMGVTTAGSFGFGSTNPGSHRIYAIGNNSGVAGSTAYFYNSNASGIAMVSEAHSTDAAAVVLQYGSGDVFRCFRVDAQGGYHWAFQVTQDGWAVSNYLQLLGGSDLSEKFDVHESEALKPEPGMAVCIDPAHPGELVVSTEAYDRRVAGIISGAGDIAPGMLMGQKGSIADGDHPVALSGRVYVMADASFAAIEPGDLLTTSDTPGHAMKVSDYSKAYGAVIGKAMTGLAEGKGLVLVLVGLQ